ncbi:NACHT domain-containing protein [Streptomyces sp. GMY02]|uniref:NACHT domain-containing protein n=1 Tax=Streptomyces sp. GMY02 TaxID=1333528 RepID=UPI001C2BC658|nr:NACHT domain-containing protein [Streptomyces sp. GMY02]QXE33316.1 NACHT domain-containing protein [Streptomyces sp. GMY02]
MADDARTGTVHNTVSGGTQGTVVQARTVYISAAPDASEQERRLDPLLRFALVGLLVAAGAVLLALAPGQSPGERGLVRLAAAYLILLGLYLGLVERLEALRKGPAELSDEDLDRATARLGTALGRRYESEELASRTNKPVPLPVRWTAARASLTSEHARSADGQFENVANFFEGLPRRRLVMLGGPGAGKSVIALSLARTLLDRRAAGSKAPVPVLLPLASWASDKVGLWSWAAERIADEHPAIGASPGQRKAVVRELLRSGRLLPVLDGFDELPTARQAGALRELGESLGPAARLVLTSRTAAYAAAVEETDGVLPSTTVVELKPLTFASVAAYLPRTTRARSLDAAGRGITKWDPVLDRMRAPDADPAARRLREVLSTPLMVALARTGYSDTPADPQDLLDEEMFASRAAIERHLLDRFLSAVYRRPGADGDPTGHGWSEDRALVWLGFLAGALRRGRVQDLAWWQLDELVPRTVRALGTVVPLAAAALMVRQIGFGQPLWLLYAAIALLALVGDWVGIKRTEGYFPPPSRLVWPSRERRRKAWLRAMGWLVVVSVPAWLVIGLLGTERRHAFAWAVMCLTLVCLAVATTQFARVARLPADPAAASEPLEMLRQDRRAALVLGAVEMPRQKYLDASEFAMVVPAAMLAVWGLNGGADVTDSTTLVVFTPAVMGVWLLYHLSLSAWGRFAVARIWLAGRGRLPWRLMAFLRDAHQRGVLRQTGGHYQFRHIELRDRLAPDVSEPRAVPAWRHRARRLGDVARVGGGTVIAIVAGLALMLVALPGVEHVAGTAGPHRSLPAPCKLLPVASLRPVFVQPLAKSAEKRQCEVKERTALLSNATVTLVTDVASAGPGESAVRVAERFVREKLHSRAQQPVAGLGDASGLEAAAGTAFLYTRVDNVVLRIVFKEQSSFDESRTTEVAKALMRIALHHARLAPAPKDKNGKPFTDTRLLASIPRSDLPSRDRLPYDDDVRRSLTGATWTDTERAGLAVRAFKDLPFDFKTSNYIGCVAGGVAWARWTCADNAPEGAQVPYLGVDINVRICRQGCSWEDATKTAAAMPHPDGLKKHDRWTLYKERTIKDALLPRRHAVGDIYQFWMVTTFTAGSWIYVVTMQAATEQAHKADAQKIVNDVYAQTARGR